LTYLLEEVRSSGIAKVISGWLLRPVQLWPGRLQGKDDSLLVDQDRRNSRRCGGETCCREGNIRRSTNGFGVKKVVSILGVVKRVNGDQREGGTKVVETVLPRSKINYRYL
jgi:hypothetical protein